MWQLFKAETCRLLKRWPRWIVLAIVTALLMFRHMYNIPVQGVGFYQLLDFTKCNLFELVIFVLFFMEGFFAFSDEHKAGIFKAAIGSGIGRHEIVISKILTAACMVLLDIALIAITALAVNLITPIFAMEPLNVYVAFVRLMICWLKVVFYLCLAGLMIYLTKHPAIGLITALILMTPLTNMGLKMLLTLDVFRGLNLTAMTPFALFDQLEASMTLGIFNPWIFLILTAVGTLMVYGAVMVFKKQELDF